MAKYFGQGRGLSEVDPRDPAKAAALQGLLAMHEKLAKQKLTVPKLPGGLGGLLPGQIVVTAVPPFDYGIVIPGNSPATIQSWQALRTRTRVS